MRNLVIFDREDSAVGDGDTVNVASEIIEDLTFRYKGPDAALTKTMTVGAEEFIRRFLQHVLPTGVHKVRYYGLWSPSHRKDLSKVQHTLTQSGNDQQERIEEDTNVEVSPPSEPRKCRHCQRGTLIQIRRLPRQGRAPP